MALIRRHTIYIGTWCFCPMNGYVAPGDWQSVILAVTVKPVFLFRDSETEIVSIIVSGINY